MAEEQPQTAGQPEQPPPAGDAGASGVDGAAPVDQSAVDELLKQATFEDAAAVAGTATDAAAGAPAAAEPGAAPVVPAEQFELPDLQRALSEAQVNSIDLLRDVDLNVKIELGRARMLVEDVLKLGEGSVVELDKLAGDPVDVFVNDRLVARGEVLVLNDNFCVRINEIVSNPRDDEL